MFLFFELQSTNIFLYRSKIRSTNISGLLCQLGLLVNTFFTNIFLQIENSINQQTTVVCQLVLLLNTIFTKYKHLSTDRKLDQPTNQGCLSTGTSYEHFFFFTKDKHIPTDRKLDQPTNHSCLSTGTSCVYYFYQGQTYFYRSKTRSTNKQQLFVNWDF